MNIRILTPLLLVASMSLQAADITIKVKSKYLNLPISHQTDRKKLTFKVSGAEDMTVEVRLADGTPDYWVFKDVSAYKGKTLKLSYEGKLEALKRIYQADTIQGQHSIYHEKNRPQYHFSTRRGWINDPNGLVFYKGIYHLYYQHNPFERDWGNMTWGHATSPDLIHWTEQPCVLFPDEMGTMFSGSAVIDSENTSGFGTKRNPPIVYAYTADGKNKETQCIAYSLDGGMTLQKYEENPVIDSGEKWQTRDTRDPRLLWYAPGKHWVMVLNERDGHSIYTSNNLKEWTYQSHITGFWECPDLFELPIDGDANNTRWVMYGASNTYMIGRFDGKTFTPEGGKYRFCAGPIYAAQTYSNVPNGRRIQVGWGQISHDGMAFNGMMLLPTELSLKTTTEGIRMVSQPVKEVKQLLRNFISSPMSINADAANALLKSLSTSEVHLRFTLQLNHRTSAGLSLNGQNIVDYDSNYNLVNGQFYSPQDPTSMELTADVYIDRTSVEVFVDDGLFTSIVARDTRRKEEGLRFWGTNLKVKNLSVDTIKSIW